MEHILQTWFFELASTNSQNLKTLNDWFEVYFWSPAFLCSGGPFWPGFSPFRSPRFCSLRKTFGGADFWTFQLWNLGFPQRTLVCPHDRTCLEGLDMVCRLFHRNFWGCTQDQLHIWSRGDHLSLLFLDEEWRLDAWLLACLRHKVLDLFWLYEP